MEIDIGIKQKDRKAIARGLGNLLADSYTLYLKTHNFHWNVTGPLFNTLHLMFEAEYTELATAVDLIAERIRALGEFAPGSYAVFGKLTTIEEATEVPRGRGDGAAARGRPRDHRPHRPQGRSHGREGRRRADVRPAHAAHAGAREDRVDAA